VPGATPAAAAVAAAKAYAAAAHHGGHGGSGGAGGALPPEKAAAAAAAAARAVAAATKPARELYFGNLYGQVSEAALRQVLEASLYAAFPDTKAAVDASGATCSPVLKTIVHPNGKFGFAEFRAPEHATACLALDGQIPVGTSGGFLLVARPVTYTEPVRLAAEAACRRAPRGGALPYPTPAAEAAAAGARQRMAADAEAAAVLVGEAVGGGGAGGAGGAGDAGQAQQGGAAAGGAGAAAAAAAGEGKDANAAAPASDSALVVVAVRGMATAATLRDPQDHTEVLEDLRAECERHGVVTGVVVPRPPRAQSELAEQLLGAEGTPYGLALARFADPLAAARCRAAVDGRVFDGRTLEARLEPEAEFLAAEAVDDLAKAEE
jgi:splicing factor U2AF subunit